MRVKDVLKLSAELRHIDCGQTTANLCDRLQLNTSRKVNELSFGNRKKVGIVCALQHNPKLLILDDTTSFLYSGDMQHLLQTLSAAQITDLSVSEPDVEEIFMHYYEKDGETV